MRYRLAGEYPEAGPVVTARAVDGSAALVARQCGLSWALRGSNPRPSPCKGDALPAELSARSCGFRVAARPTHHVAELDRQTRPVAVRAPVQAVGPVRSITLAVGTHQHLPTTHHRPRPRRRSLIGVEGRAAAQDAPRPVHRLGGTVEQPHDQQGYGSTGYAQPRVRWWAAIGHPAS
jgi:hypothetical protein